MLFQLIQIIYWIALSTWFGSVLFIALAAPTIFRTVRQSNPILTNVLSVNLEGQHSTLLAGTIVANLIQRLLTVELICGSALLLALIAHPFVIDMSAGSDPLSSNRAAAVLRSILFLGAVGIRALRLACCFGLEFQSTVKNTSSMPMNLRSPTRPKKILTASMAVA